MMNRRNLFQLFAAALLGRKLPTVRTAAPRARALKAAAPPPAPPGLSIRIIRSYSVQDGRILSRMDVLFGHGVIAPEFTARITA